MTAGYDPTILVTGASGLFGGEIAKQLSAIDVAIRILVRNPARAPGLDGHIETTIGDFGDPDSLQPALEGIERIFVASYDRPEMIEHQANILAAARSAGVRHVVRLSTNGTDEYAHLPIFQQHQACDRQLIDSGLDYTLLKPVWVMQNFASFLLIDDSIRVPAGDGVAAQIDARDVATVAIAALTEEGHAGKGYILGAEALSHGEIARVLSRSTGRTISYVDLDPEAYRRELESAGWAIQSIDSMLGLFADIRAGTNSDSTVGDTILPILGRPAIRFRQFAEDYATRI
ncbi:SDR family oxidoreductase [Pseudomonadota bacterium]